MAERMLVVWCPDWPVVATGRSLDDPVAIMFANRVVACSPGARVRDVRRGIRQREAQARCADIVLLSRDDMQEAAAFEAVVSIVETIAVGVQVMRPGVCALATRGPSRYFGGDHELAEHIQTMVANAGYECRVGVADGLFAATCAARRNRIVDSGESGDYLAPLPVSLLEQPQLTDLLVRLGLHTLGDFAQLQSSDVLARFGNEGVEAHRHARGEDDHIIVGRDLPIEFGLEAVIDPPAEQVDRASFAARNAANQLLDQLDRHAMACRLLRIEVETEHGESRSRQWRHEIGFTVATITDRVRWQLAGWLTGIDEGLRPTAGINLVRLIPEEVVPGNGRQTEFWGGESDADIRAKRAIDRVRGLLGAEAVLQAVPKGGRGVAEQFELIPWGDEVVIEHDASQPWPGRLPSPAPATVCRPPRFAEVIDDIGASVVINRRGMLKNAPQRFRFDTNDWFDIAAWAGPWLYDERWWDTDFASRRACFQFATDDGTAVLASCSGGMWTIEAVYD